MMSRCRAGRAGNARIPAATIQIRPRVWRSVHALHTTDVPVAGTGCHACWCQMFMHRENCRRLRTIISSMQMVCIHKESACRSAGASGNSARARAQECAALGIAGHDVPAEVAGLQAELPALLRAAAEQVQAGALDAAMRYYADFLAYTAPLEVGAGAGGASRAAGQDPAGGATNPTADALPPDLLPALQEVRRAELGDPAADAAAALGLGLGPANPGRSSGGSAAGIAWDLGAGEEDSAAAAIDWDAPVGPDPEAGESTADSATMEVSWDTDAEADEPASGGAASVDADPGGGCGAAGGQSEGGPAGVDWDIGVAAAGEQAPQQSAAGARAPDTPGARRKGSLDLQVPDMATSGEARLGLHVGPRARQRA